MNHTLDVNLHIAGWQLPSQLDTTLEVISNLAFLAHNDADDPAEVRKYTEMIQERITMFNLELRRTQNRELGRTQN
jgi:hypothetical protein